MERTCTRSPLLANTNALVYKEEEEQEALDRLKDALKSNGIEIKKNKPSEWTSEDVQNFLQQMIVTSFENNGRELDGKSLLEMNSDAFEHTFATAVKRMKKQIFDLQEKACEEEDEEG